MKTSAPAIDAEYEHKRDVNSAALKALMKLGLTEAQGVDVVVAIFCGKIPAEAISY
jgi:hypothetical protein